MDTAKRLKELRELKGYTINKLATISGLSQGFVRQIELGEKQPTIDSLSKLCTGLGISLADFFADQATELPDQMKPLVSHLVSFAQTLTPDQKEALRAIGKSLTDIT